MTKKKLLEDITGNPPRFYRMPADVLRDRRFSNLEKREILQAWQAADEGAQIDGLMAELESRSDAGDHAAE